MLSIGRAMTMDYGHDGILAEVAGDGAVAFALVHERVDARGVSAGFRATTLRNENAYIYKL